MQIDRFERAVNVDKEIELGGISHTFEALGDAVGHAKILIDPKRRGDGMG